MEQKTLKMHNIDNTVLMLDAKWDSAEDIVVNSRMELFQNSYYFPYWLYVALEWLYWNVGIATKDTKRNWQVPRICTNISPKGHFRT